MTNKKLEVLYIELTNNCNYNCIHCGNEGDKPSTLDTKLVEDVLQEFKDQGGTKLIITGGEPLLHPGIERILETAQQHDFNTKISTNAQLLNYPYSDFAFRYGVGFRLSLDGPEEKHNEIRGNPRAYDYLISAMKRISERGGQIVVRTTVMKKNMDSIAHMLYELDRLTKYHRIKVQSNNIWPIRNIGKANQEQAITAKEYGTFLVKLNEGTRYLKPSFRIIVGPTFGLEKEFQGGPIQSNEIYKYDIMGSSLHIASNGDVYPCSFIHHSLGNIKQDRILKIFHSQESAEFREKFLERKNHECSSCKSYQECKGGCVAETYKELFDPKKQNKVRDIYCFR